MYACHRCVVLLWFVCMALLASFLLHSSSLIKMHICEGNMYMIACPYTYIFRALYWQNAGCLFHL